MRLQFLGATTTVTGSRTLVTTPRTRLLVDCGMFQGFKANRLRNRDPLDTGGPLDAVVLTHAHLDHSGWCPALVRQGYEGPIYCTSATVDLLRILWPDSGRIQEADAEYANRKGSTRHAPALPLYTEADALHALKQLVPVDFHQPLSLGDIRVTFRGAGHILGAASVELRTADQSVLFSGDLGRVDDAVVPAPEPPSAVDAIVMESTYGDRLHPPIDRLDRLSEVINTTVERDGMVLIPSFAVGRAQGLMWGLHQLMEAGRIPRLRIALDSPMATKATQAFLRHPGDLRLTPSELEAMTKGVQFVGGVEESKALNQRSEPFILIAASGMLTGGRVLHHLAIRAPIRRNTLLFVGFQAPGTRGGRIIAGEKTIKMFGRKIPIRCDVEEIGGFSAHADAEGLHAWLRSAPERPSHVFLNHGESHASDALRRRLKDDGYAVTVASEGIAFDIGDLPEPVRTVATPVPHPDREDAAFGGAALVFEEDTDAAAEGVRDALWAMKTGRLMRLPVVVRGTLANKVRNLLTDDALERVIFE
jgi:metallo-beta-lactamase family protein